jgi:hypothetical protein
MSGIVVEPDNNYQNSFGLLSLIESFMAYVCIIPASYICCRTRALAGKAGLFAVIYVPGGAPFLQDLPGKIIT